MKKNKGKTLTAVLLAILLLAGIYAIGVLAVPGSTNADRWPGLTKSGDKTTVIPYPAENVWITFDNYKSTDYSATSFVKTVSGTGPRQNYTDGDSHCYFPHSNGMIIQYIPLPSNAVHKEGEKENGYWLNLQFPGYASSSTQPTLGGVDKYFRGQLSGDFYKPVLGTWQFTYEGIQRSVPQYLIAYRENMEGMDDGQAAEYIANGRTARRMRDLCQKARELMGKIESQTLEQGEGKMLSGDYHPVYDYMVFSAYREVCGKLLGKTPESNATVDEYYNLMLSRAKSRDMNLEPEQCIALMDVLEYYINLAESTRIAEPDILSFTYMDSPGVVDRENLSITVWLPDNVVMNREPVITTVQDSAVVKSEGNLSSERKAVYTVAAYDPTTPVIYWGRDYKFYEFWGDVQKNWTVTVQTGTPVNRITDFSIEVGGENFQGVIDENQKTITLNLPLGTDLTKLHPEVSYLGERLTFGVQDMPYTTDTVVDFSSSQATPVKFIVENSRYSLKTEYKVTVTASASAENKILSYVLGDYQGEIDQTARTIIVDIPESAKLSELKETINCSRAAKVKRITEGELDFEKPFTYQVTAEDGTVGEYILTIRKALRIESFQVGGQEALIDHKAKTITLMLPQGTDKTSLSPVITLSPEGAIVSPASGQPQNFSNTVAYTVSYENRSSIYQVTMTVQNVLEEERKAKMERLLGNIISRYRVSAQDDWEWLNLGFYDHLVRSPGDALPGELNLAGRVQSLSRDKMTDYARGIMALTAMGVDCTRLDAYNGGEKITHSSGVDISNLVAETYNYPTDDTINGPTYWLIAMDMGRYTVPSDAKYTREDMVERLLAHQYGTDKFGIDMVAMLMQALYPYRDDPRVQAKLEDGLAIILGDKKVEDVIGMTKDYQFGAWGAYNSESAAQVICALCSMGIDPHTDPRFSDGNGNSVLTAWLDRYVTAAEDGFGHTSNSWNQMATYQGGYALQWYLGFLENGGAGHPYSLYYDRGFDFSTQFSTEADILSFTLEGKEGKIEGDNITVVLPDTISLNGLTPEVTLSDGAKLVSPEFPFNFVAGTAQPFKVVAQDGVTDHIYYVTVNQEAGVLSSGTMLKPDTIKVKDENQRDLAVQGIKTAQGSDGVTEITLTLGPDADISKLRLYGEISERAASSVDLNYGQVVSLRDWLTITITAEDGVTTRDYRIRGVQDAYAGIDAFSVTIDDVEYIGIINQSTGQILIQGVPAEADVTMLIPDIVLSEGTTGCMPLMNVSQDFTSPVEYTVTGAGKTARTYTVTVVRNGEPSGNPAQPEKAAITEFVINGCKGVIDNGAGTIVVTLPYGTDITALIPQITVSGGGVVSPVSGAAVNLSMPVVYTVSNALGSRQYTVTVVLEKPLSEQMWEKLPDEVHIVKDQTSYDNSFLSRDGSGGSGGDGSGGFHFDQRSEDHSILSR